VPFISRVDDGWRAPRRTRPGGKTLEFKRELSAPDRVPKTIVAFANTAGGTRLIGVDDRTRRVRGIGEPLDVEERLANLMSDGIAPRLLPEIEILPWRRTHKDCSGCLRRHGQASWIPR